MNQEAMADPITERLPVLEGLRGVLSLWVLVYHVLTISGWWKILPAFVQGFGNGANAVDVFILLSGFVITRLLLAKREPYFIFLFKRYARLFPVFLMCLISALAVQALGYMPIRFMPQDFPLLLAANVMLIHGAIPDSLIHGASGAILNPAWSISLEWQFYLVAPFLVALVSRGGMKFIVASAACIVLYRMVAPNLVGYSDAFLPFKIQLFWIGIVSSLAYRWYATNINRHRTGRVIVLALLTTSILLLPYKQNVGLLIWIMVINILAGRSKMVSNFLGSDKMIFIGSISYPIYLVHEIIIWTMIHFVSALSIYGLIFLLLTVAFFTIFISWVLHKAIEKPANNFAKSLFG